MTLYLIEKDNDQKDERQHNVLQDKMIRKIELQLKTITESLKQTKAL